MKTRALRLLARLSGSLAIPPEAWRVACPLLHVSDTPSVFYPDLARLLAAVRPRFVVHTGDLADEVKIRSGVLDRARLALEVIVRVPTVDQRGVLAQIRPRPRGHEEAARLARPGQQRDLRLLEEGARGGVVRVQAAPPDRIDHLRQREVVREHREALQPLAAGVGIGLLHALNRPVAAAEGLDLADAHQLV